MAGTAHIVFFGGRLVLPAQTVYDRQLLVEHVLDQAWRRQSIRVRVDYATWIVERPSAQHPIMCRACARRIARAVCRHPGKGAAVYCVGCALGRPRLTVAFLKQLPATALLRDVQAHYAYGSEWIAWTRWPQATPAEIVEDMRLQRRFAPVLTWNCAEIRLAPTGVRRAPQRSLRSRISSWAAASGSTAPSRALHAR
jgi:hypothetical protein